MAACCNRLMPVEGSIPHIPEIEMYGASLPAETVGATVETLLITH